MFSLLLQKNADVVEEVLMVLRNQQRELTELRSQMETMQSSILSQVEHVLTNHQEQERIPFSRRGVSVSDPPHHPRALAALTGAAFREPPGPSPDGEPEPPAAAPGAAEPAAEPRPHLGAHQPRGQAAEGGDEENRPTK